MEEERGPKKEEGEKNWAIDSLTFLELFFRKY